MALPAVTELRKTAAKDGGPRPKYVPMRAPTLPFPGGFTDFVELCLYVWVLKRRKKGPKMT